MSTRSQSLLPFQLAILNRSRLETAAPRNILTSSQAADSAMSDALSIPDLLTRRLRARLRSWTTPRHTKITKPCPLLKLPPELRLLIYGYVYGDVYCGLEVTQDLRLIRAYYGNGDLPLGEELPRLTALLRTCKLIGQEAAPVLIQRTIFCIHRLPHLDASSVPRRLTLPGDGSGMLQHMRQDVWRPWTDGSLDVSPTQAEKFLGHALASNSIIHSARRVVLDLSAFNGDEVDEVVALITVLISIFNAHENGLVECGIELSSASSSSGYGDVVLRAFSAIRCQKKVKVRQRVWLTDYYSDREWAEMLVRLDALEVKTRRVGACLRITA
ncbi:hypothetical protein EJ03DRAFT_192704 [Teratosphaeria nubilosa]|uniref:Uncharacterized protein n=1 Tax=Teratosphaeria nubilosa TaxID=161662 RepID=A0A6G1L1F6_9PEZI|nr:hypothetical protein EJ03DRAFT_192704 [Teratosphaeria nubilosa]